jgi:hypothetical protein
MNLRIVNYFTVGMNSRIINYFTVGMNSQIVIYFSVGTNSDFIVGTNSLINNYWSMFGVVVLSLQPSDRCCAIYLR